LTDTQLPPEVFTLDIPSDRPLVIVDVDEVVGMFMRGFEVFIGGHGLEMRIDRFALFQNIFRPGAAEHLDLESGRLLFNRFFEADVEHIDPAPGAAEALKALADHASIVVLTNAPGHSREPRSRWLVKHGFDYPMVVNVGVKGPPMKALAAKTKGKAAFIDDLLPNLESVAEMAPAVARFQHVADERLRPLAFSDPDRHPRIDDWEALGRALAAAIEP
jgi:hypothetical protein